MKLFRKLVFPLILITSSLIFAWPYFHAGLPEADDNTAMVVRSSAFHQAFRDGHIPTRWLGRLNENYGYPVTNFLYPLPFYLAEPLLFAGLPTIISIKILFVIATVFASLGTYLFLSHQTAPWPAFLGSLLLIFSPYYFSDHYVRGSLGEIVAFALIPFIFLFIDHYFKSRRLNHLLVSSTFFALLITAHNTLAFIFSPIIISYFILKIFTINKDKHRLIVSCFLFLVSSLSLSAFFWVPALTDLQFTRSSLIQISRLSDQFVSPPELIAQIGLIRLVVLLASTIFLSTVLAKFFIAFYSIAIFIQIPAALPLWNIFALDKLVQFPLRFQSIIIFVSSILIAFLAHDFAKKKRHILLVLLSLMVAFEVGLVSRRLPTIEFNYFASTFFETNFDSTTNQKEFTPISVKQDPSTHAPTPYEIAAGHDEYTVTESIDRAQEKFTQIVLDQNVSVIFNTHYFPGWTLYVDDNLTQPTVREDGRIQVDITPGRHKRRDIKLVWQETPFRQLADALTLTAALFVISVLSYHYTRSNLPKTAAVISLVIILTSLSQALLIRHRDFSQPFDPAEMKQRYLDSQWVNPDSKRPIGDHGLYSWAGWAYIHGENPVLINAEMPPLGKYLIGLGLTLTRRPALVGLFFSLTLLISVYLLSHQVLADRYLALIPVAIFSTETIFTSSLTYTMLDSIQLTFVSLAFLFLLKSNQKPRWLIPAALMLGGVLSTKFYAGGLLVITSVFAYYFCVKNFNHLKLFLFHLPLVFLVHLASYFQFFIAGNSLRDYLGVQKYIYNFYRQGAPSVPIGSYWKLVFFNRWRVWWGPQWGFYYTLTTREWQPTWVINALAALFSIYQYLKLLAINWLKSKTVKIADYHLLTSWLIFYSAFLTFIGGWPHYMLLFLPFSNIILVKLFYDNRHKIKTFIRHSGARLTAWR